MSREEFSGSARDRNGGVVEELEWLLGVARELAGSPEVTVTFARGSIAASARLVLTGIEAAGIGDDVGSALRDLCDGLEHGLLAPAEAGQRNGVPRSAPSGPGAG
ncbi:MAG: hypothetical protein M3550_13340 [Actinomycetota bacterium]|nr:hypothetical protein [Actinomycetota bacterium]